MLSNFTAVMLDMQIYQAERSDQRVRVYNLLYEDSQEADKFSAAVAREVTRRMSWLLCTSHIKNNAMHDASQCRGICSMHQLWIGHDSLSLASNQHLAGLAVLVLAW